MGPQLPIRLGRDFRRGESDQDKIGMTLGHIKTQGPAIISESLADLYCPMHDRAHVFLVAHSGSRHHLRRYGNIVRAQDLAHLGSDVHGEITPSNPDACQSVSF